VLTSVHACALLGLHARVVLARVHVVVLLTHAAGRAVDVALFAAEVLMLVLTSLGTRVGALGVQASSRARFRYFML
jgi:hypothetical protein